MAYDRADFDYSTEQDPLPKGHAAIHIGMFLAWAVMNNLENDWHKHRSAALLQKLRNREITGKQFFEAACGDRFSERDLSPEGNEFAEFYYIDNAGHRGTYFEDYKKTLAARAHSFWHVEDTWANYDQLAPLLTKRFLQWKNPVKKKWWQFWK